MVFVLVPKFNQWTNIHIVQDKHVELYFTGKLQISDIMRSHLLHSIWAAAGLGRVRDSEKRQWCFGEVLFLINCTT